MSCRGILAYFATDGDRNQNKSMLEALFRSVPDVSMRIQFRYEISERLGDLLEQLRSRAAHRAVGGDGARFASAPDVATKGKQRLLLREPASCLLHLGPAHSREALPLRSAEPQRLVDSLLSQKKAIQRARKEHETYLAEFESILRGIEGSMEAASLGPRRLSTQELFEELKHAQHPIRRDRRPYVPRRGDDRVSQRAGTGGRGEHPQRDRDLPEHRWVSLCRRQPQGTARCDLSGDAAELFDSWLSGRRQRAGRDPGPGEGAQELQEAPAEDDSRAKGRERKLQIESRSRGRAGAAHPGPARHHLLLAQDGQAEPCRLSCARRNRRLRFAISNGRSANSPTARRRF